MSAESTTAQVKPRHVLCFLGGERSLAHLSDAASGAIHAFAAGFTVDRTYSQDQADERMPRSFDVCWDRVEPNDWTPADEQAVASHRSVLYVLGPPMTKETAVDVSAIGLRLVERLIESGAIAVKGESAGVAHGLSRWRQLNVQAESAASSGEDVALSRVCRIAFAKRPLDTEKVFQTVGFHLVGLPEVYVSRTSRDRPAVMDAVAAMDAVADEMKQRDLEEVLRVHGATMSYASAYETDDFKFNPYGIVELSLR